MSATRAFLLIVVLVSCYIGGTPPTPPVRVEDQTMYRKKGLSSAAEVVERLCGVGVLIQKLSILGIILVDAIYASNTSARYYLHKTTGTSVQTYSDTALSLPFMLGVACIVSGALIRLWSYRTLGAHFTYQLSILKDHKLITTGPYAYVRHPSYTGLVIIMVGVIMCETSSGSWWIAIGALDTALGKFVALLISCIVVFVGQVVSRAWEEDRMLAEQFGEAWLEWQKEVPRLFVLGVL